MVPFDEPSVILVRRETPVPRLEDPIRLNQLRVRNRLYRAPVLECAGNGPDAVETFIRDLEPAAAAGAGMIVQGDSIVRGDTGCGAPNMTRVHDPDFVHGLEPLPRTLHEHGAKIFMQLGHAGIRSRDAWHRDYWHPEAVQLAVSPPPLPPGGAAGAGLHTTTAPVMTSEEIRELAADFGRSAGWAVEAGYDGIHLVTSNATLLQQFLSPYYNRREDDFGGSVEKRVHFFELLYREIRDRVGEGVPIITKVPSETPSPGFVRRFIDEDQAVEIARRFEAIGYDALVPVTTSVFWGMSVVRGEFPRRAWNQPKFREHFHEAFGGRIRTNLLSWIGRRQSSDFAFESAWNEPFFGRVKEAVEVPVLGVGGIRRRDEIDRLLSAGQCDMVGMARPFYAEPRLPARLLGNPPGSVAAVCESCNNCTVTQVGGLPGTCRTPTVMERKAALQKDGAYENGGGGG